MKLFRIIIWTGFLLITVVFWYSGRLFSEAGVPGIVSFEFADAEKGKAIFVAWQQTGLLSLVCNMISWDFLYIFFYVALIITLSNHQVRKEPSIAVNALLRSSFFFAIIAGSLDIVENLFLLYNIHHWNDTSYISSFWIAWAKFIAAGWAVVIWLFSLVKSLVTKIKI